MFLNYWDDCQNYNDLRHLGCQLHLEIEMGTASGMYEETIKGLCIYSYREEGANGEKLIQKKIARAPLRLTERGALTTLTEVSRAMPD